MTTKTTATTAMRLNSLRPAAGAKTTRRRVGRGIGSGLGKTCGKGHKGQKARAGGYHKVGFEGGQMPMQRRLPKTGFRSRQKLWHEELQLSTLNKLDATEIDFAVLKEKGVINANTKTVKLIATGKLEKALTVRGIPMSKGAKTAIETAGGKVEE